MQKVKFLILSVLSILNIAFVPVFDVWGGLFPGKTDYDFFYAINAFFTDRDSWSEWVVIFSLAIFIPSLLMLIMSLINSRTGFLITSMLGVISESAIIVLYISQNELYEIMPSDDCSVSIGTWTALTIFIVSFVIAIKSKKNTSIKHQNNNLSINVETDNTINQVVIEKGNFCPNCGNKMDKQTIFCGNCGYKF